MDNVFIERLWRSLKHEEVYLKGHADGLEARAGIGAWIAFYNAGDRRPLANGGLARRHHLAAWRDGCGHDACPSDKLGQRGHVAHMSTAATPATRL
jgi:hypothetical protein